MCVCGSAQAPPSGAHRHRGDPAGLRFWPRLRVASPEPPGLLPYRGPPGRRAVPELSTREKSLQCRAEAGNPEPRGLPLFKCARRRPCPGRLSRRTRAPERRLEARPEAAEELLLRAVAAGPGRLQELSGIGRGRAGSLFHGDSSRVPAAAAAAAESPFVLLGPPSFPVSLPLSACGSR